MTWRYDSTAVKFDSTKATHDGAIRLNLALSIIEAFTVADSNVTGFVRLRNISEALSAADANVKVFSLCRQIVDAIQQGDAVMARGFLQIALVDAFGVSDSQAANLKRIVLRQLLENFGLLDSLFPAVSRVLAPKITDSFLAFDFETTKNFKLKTATIQDAISIVSNQSAGATRIRGLFDALTTQDLSLESMALVRGLIDVIDVNDTTQYPARVVVQQIIDAFDAVSRHAAMPVRVRNVIELLQTTDQNQWTPVKMRALLENILAQDANIALYLPFIFAGIDPSSPIIIGMH